MITQDNTATADGDTMVSNWADLPASAHLVRFYDSEESLVESIAQYTAAGLEKGEAVMAVLTGPHRHAVERSLQNLGISAPAFYSRGQLVLHDAEETLAALYVEHALDYERFEGLVATQVGELVERWPSVRVVGQMTTLLWRDGKHDEAYRLESLWNELRENLIFSLFCAYPREWFCGEDLAAMEQICGVHDYVVSTPDRGAAGKELRLSPTVVALEQRAQALEAEIAKRVHLERELYDFMENALEGFYKVAPDGKILWCNRAVFSLLGFEPAAVIGRPVQDLFIEREAIEGILRDARTGSRVIERPMRLRCQGSGIKDVLLTVSACSQNGVLRYYRFYTRDITEKLAADRDRGLLAAIIEGSQDAIVSKSLDGIIQSWNRGAERLFGYTAEEMIGRSIRRIIPPDRLREEDEILSRLRRGERIDHFDTVRVTKSGTLIDISLTISPIHDGAGRVVGASKVARDITARKRTELALRESEERFTRFMDSLPGLAWIKDQSGRYVFANRAVERPFGIRVDDMQGRSDEELFSRDVALQFKENDRLALSSDTGIQVIESMPHDDGVHHCIVSKFPIHVAGGSRFVGGVAIDITERLRVEEALREADRRKDEFLATLAHELRNPLAPIRNGLEVLRLGGLNAGAGTRILEMMERQVGHMVRLVDDLLEVSRISRGSIELKKERIALGTVITHAVETSMPFIEARGHDLEVVVPAEEIMIEGDLIRLSQVFSNLLNNAAKFTSRGGKIGLSVVSHRGEVTIAVCDNGAGIPTSMLTHIFEMFTQVHTGRGEGGLGIGLNLARTLISMHSGSIEAHSDGPGKGSKFVVKLPRADALGTGAEAERANGALCNEPELKSQRIIAVDDNRDSADSLGMLLKFLGAEVEVAYDGRTALDKVRSLRPTVVLLDLGMPGMDGYEVARRIREEPESKGVTLIALTGWGQEDDRSRAKEAGFDHHLVKPVDIGELQALLNSLHGA